MDLPLVFHDTKYKDYVYGRCYYRSTWKSQEYLKNKDKAEKWCDVSRHIWLHMSKYKTKLGYTIHYVMDFEAVERVQLGHSKEMNGWHQMLETGVRRKSYMPLWITNATELLSRIALSVNVSLPIWRSRRTDIPSCPCWQIWLQGCDDLFRWHRYFCNVINISIQDKCSFNQTIWN